MRCLSRLFAVSLAACLTAAASDPANAPQDALFGTLPLVEAASLHAQSLQEAPANVSIVSDREIRRYGYRTLNEVLSSVRGFYTSYDRIYHYVGINGFSLPGDYNTRFLVMLNGHPLTVPTSNSNGAFGQDFPIDLDLVARIEVIRGPTSALYGSNGILASINIVTKSPVDAEAFRVSPEFGSYGERKVLASASLNLGGGANLLISASVFHSTGAIQDVDGEQGTFANLVWHNWSFTGLFSNRVKQPPVPWGEEALFYERGDYVRDGHNLLLATRTSKWKGGQFRWESYFNQYKYDDRFDYPSAGRGIIDVRSTARGESAGTQLTWAHDTGLGEFTTGSVLDVELRNLQQDHDTSPEIVYSAAIRHPDLTGGLFAQQQWRVSRAFTAYGGLRLDASRNFGPSLSPRLALIYQAGEHTTFKTVYGRPFRNPSAFESYYTDGGKAFLANPQLHPETAQTLEFSVEHRLLPGISLTGAVYRYHLKNTIRAVYLPNGVSMYQNVGSVHSRGIQLELSGKPGHRLEAGAAYTLQFANEDGLPQTNLPRHIGQFHAATPFQARRMWLTGSLETLSARTTLSGVRERPVALAGLTLSTERLHPNFDLAGGVRNLAGWRYADPVGLGVDRMPQDGRTWFIKLIYHTRE